MGLLTENPNDRLCEPYCGYMPTFQPLAGFRRLDHWPTIGQMPSQHGHHNPQSTSDQWEEEPLLLKKEINQIHRRLSDLISKDP